jgi:hypothetical protein
MFRGIRQGLGRLAVTALLTIGAVLPAAAASGKFVYVSGNGHVTSFAFSPTGNGQLGPFSGKVMQINTGLSHAVFAGNGTLLLYENGRGWFYLYQIADDGNFLYRGFQSFGSGWDRIIPLGRDQFLFYQWATGAAKTVTITSDGRYVTSRDAVGFRPFLSHIVATAEDTLFCYNQSTGEVVTGRLFADNRFRSYQEYEMEKFWWHIVPQGNQLLLYNGANGVAATAILWGDGTYQFQRYLPVQRTGWDKIEPMAYGQISYNGLTGWATTTQLEPDGSLKQLQAPFRWTPGNWLIACQRPGT